VAHAVSSGDLVRAQAGLGRIAAAEAVAKSRDACSGLR
jgi:hypothetical protein